MRVNPGHAAKHRKNSEIQPKKRKMQTVRTVSARTNGKSGKSGRVALSGVALSGVEKPERGHKKRNDGTKTGTRAHSPKPPFYEALLFPLEYLQDAADVRDSPLTCVNAMQ